MSKQYNFSVIGCGRQGERRILASRSFENLQLLGVHDYDKDYQKKLADKWSVPELSREEAMKADIVVIATPPTWHEEYALEALTEGRHVLCEKPITLNAREGTVLRAIARGRNLVLRTGYHLRHYRGISELKHIIESGKLGEIRWASFEYGSERPADFASSWRANPKVTGGGVLADQGVHIIDLAVYLLGNINVNYAHINCSGLVAPEIDDDINIYASSGKTRIKLSSSWLDYDARFGVRLKGTEGKTTLYGLEGHYGPQAIIHNGVIRTLQETPVWEFEWWDIIEEIEGRKHVGSDGVEASAIMEQIYTRF